MKAVKIEKPWKIKLVETNKPKSENNYALIKIASAGICGSDIGAFRGTNSLVSYPRVIGHELAGIIVSIAGRIVYTGWPKNETSLPTDLITKKELDIRGARTSAGEFEEAVSLIYNKKVDVESILTKTISLNDVPKTVAEIESSPENYIKVNVIF